MKRILYVSAALLTLALAAEIALTVLAQRGMEKSLSRIYGLPDNTEVAIGAFPFLVSLARGRLAEVRIEWRGECLLSQADRETTVTYLCTSFLNDVEIDFPALLRGDLRLHNLGRVETSLEVPLQEIASFLGMGEVLACEGGGFSREGADGIGRRYGVKVEGDSRITVYETSVAEAGAEGSTGSARLEAGRDMQIEMRALPLGARTKSAGVEGESMVIEVSIPEWEGCMRPSTGTLKFHDEANL